MSLIGCSRRTFYYAKARLEKWVECGVVFRTVTLSSGRGWQILVGGAASHLYLNKQSGQSRHARPSLLRTECNPYIGSLRDPVNLSHVRRFTLSPKQRSLAHWIKNELRWRHWDNCKVDFSPGLAFRYVEYALIQGHEISHILAFYGHYLEYYHGLATDSGARWVASGTVAAARRGLDEMSFSAPPPPWEYGAKNHRGEAEEGSAHGYDFARKRKIQQVTLPYPSLINVSTYPTGVIN